MVNTSTSDSTNNNCNDVIVRRLYARGTWKVCSVAHFGGNETDIADMCLLKDADGNPFIPGASIAGAARSFLAQQSQVWEKYKTGAETSALKRLFGGDMRLGRKQPEKNKDTMSALIVADADCKQAETSIRDGVRVEHSSGSAAMGAKFDIEVVERGTEFNLSLECIIRREDDQRSNKPNLEDLFFALLHAFQEGHIRLGARTRRGYGRGKVASWDIVDLQMCNPEHVMTWLSGDIWSCNANTNLESSKLKPRGLKTDCRKYFRIEADFALQTSLLIRSTPTDTDSEEPGAVHLHYGGEPTDEKAIVPGTSFAGAFRHRATLIAETLCWPKEDGDKDTACEMFGPVHEQKPKGKLQEPDQAEFEENTEGVHAEESNEARQKELWASRVWIEEHLAKNIQYRWQYRVAIDRFTGGSLDTALFDEKPVYPLSLKDPLHYHLRLTLMLEEPEDAEIGLLLLTLRDFWYGHAALGGETSNGRGTLRGLSAELRLKRHILSDPVEDKVWKLSSKRKNSTETQSTGPQTKGSINIEGDAAFLECCVKAAQTYANQPTCSRRPDKEEEIPDA